MLATFSCSIIDEGNVPNKMVSKIDCRFEQQISLLSLITKLKYASVSHKRRRL